VTSPGRTLLLKNAERIDLTVEDSSSPARVIWLPDVIDRPGFSFLAEFPPGWQRSRSGWYTQSEEIFVIEGELQINDITHQKDGYAWLPSGYLRSRSTAPNGALVVARFHGQPRWQRSKSFSPQYLPEETVITNAANVEETASPLQSGSARLLRSGRCNTTFTTDTFHGIVPAGHAIEIFSLNSRTWTTAKMDSDRIDISEKALCRLVRTSVLR